MEIIKNLSYNEFIALLLTYTAKSDNDFDINERYMLTKKVDFEDLKKAETMIRSLDKDQIMEIIKEAYSYFSKDKVKKVQIYSDLEEIINSDGFVHENELEILNTLKEFDKSIHN
ncbi:hypothetical protein OAQ99_02275 [Candidatus Kapabacteria bacterium]|nr:hypothetical protein [Candidatus Kapabacteria bacterium]